QFRTKYMALDRVCTNRGRLQAHYTVPVGRVDRLRWDLSILFRFELQSFRNTQDRVIYCAGIGIQRLSNSELAKSVALNQSEHTEGVREMKELSLATLGCWFKR